MENLDQDDQRKQNNDEIVDEVEELEKSNAKLKLWVGCGFFAMIISCFLAGKAISDLFTPCD